MRLYSEAIFYLNGAQELSFFKSSELYKQCLAVLQCCFLGPQMYCQAARRSGPEDRHSSNSFSDWLIGWLAGWIICSFIHFNPPGHERYPSSWIFLLFIIFLLASMPFLFRVLLQLRSPLESPKSKLNSSFHTQFKFHTFHKIFSKNFRVNWFWI